MLGYLFNEEIGLVVQVPADGVEAFTAACPVAVDDVGSATLSDQIVIRQGEAVLIDESRAALQRTWARTSHAIQRLRDDETCADQEYAAIAESREDNPGLSAQLTFDTGADVCAPYVGKSRPTIAILREQGVNGQLEMAAAFDAAGFDCVDVHMSDLVAGRTSLMDFGAMVACGGFSYGDVLGGGGGWAKSALFNEGVRAQFADFLAADRLVLGVCNGCQMLSQLQELIPGAAAWPSFVRNRSEQFEGRVVLTRINPTNSPWLADMAGSVMPVAVAHGEGRAEFVDAGDLERLRETGQLAMQYVDARYDVTERYPDNPNGAPQGVAAVTAAEGRVLIMMPHPERVYRSCQNVWQDESWGEYGPWMRLFRNARVALG